jgi:serine/threonine protein kinase/Flp pilus assembly protein TadD
MPEVGQSFLGFKLVGELGRGAFAKVFLAEQQTLAGRQVALKITLRPTREPDRLARLQHPNIVPVYSVHPANPAQVICMPFRGRRTLSDLLRRWRPSAGGSGRRPVGTRKVGSTTVAGSRLGSSGQQLSGSHRKLELEQLGEDACDLLGNPDAVLRVMRQLADGLAHAHARGILHLDLKPANILLADSGEPMLLDFNLSHDTTVTDRDLVGGTIPYMAPEQIDDLRSRGQGGVDERTDLYGLGAVAFELLTGSVPFGSVSRSTKDYEALIAARMGGPPRLRDKNPAVSPAAEAIVLKLLSADPAGRYQSAAALCEDLDRQLSDRPLRHTPNPSVRERVQKWRRRNPKAVWWIASALFLGAAAAFGVSALRANEARAAVVAATRAKEARVTVEATRLDLVLPGSDANRKRGIDRATTLLAGYGLPDNPNWKARPDVHRLPPDDRAALAADLGELMLLVAHAKWHEARAKPDADRRVAADESTRYIRAAGPCFGPGESPPLLARLSAVVTGAPEADVPVADPSFARDYFLEAVGLIAEGRYSASVPHLKAAVGRRPGDGPAQYLLAHCLKHLGKYAEAAERYEVAEVLLPNDPRPPLARGLIFARDSRNDDAEKQFTRAIEIEPGTPDAYLHRGRVRTRLGKLGEAEADLTAALDLGGPPLQVRLSRAETRKLMKDDAGAKADLAAAATTQPVSEYDFLVRGSLKVKADPRGAVDDFRAAAAVNPRSLPALQNQAHVLAEKLGANEEALALSAKATAWYPEFAPARAGHAVLLARLGRRDEAHREAEQARLLSKDPYVTYQLGCVYALTAADHPEDSAKALTLLRQAFRDGYSNVGQLSCDPDLAALRGSAEFISFVGAAKTLFRDR